MPISKFGFQSLLSVISIVTILVDPLSIPGPFFEQLISMKWDCLQDYSFLVGFERWDVLLLIGNHELCHFTCNIWIEKLNTKTTLQKTDSVELPFESWLWLQQLSTPPRRRNSEGWGCEKPNFLDIYM